MHQDFTEEQEYIRVKKKVKEIKGFYIHLLVFCLVMPIIIAVNLIFVPGYHFFWFSLLGWGIGVFMNWLVVFGFKLLGFDSNWEQNKINEILEENKKKFK